MSKADDYFGKNWDFNFRPSIFNRKLLDKLHKEVTPDFKNDSNDEIIRKMIMYHSSE